MEDTMLVIFNMLSLKIPEIEKLISNAQTTIIAMTSITIVLSIVSIIRQRKILRKLDELAKKTEEPTAEDKP